MFFIVIAAYWMVACNQVDSDKSVESKDLAVVESDSLVQPETPESQVDAVSGATEVPNCPMFNGVIMAPPQQHATITLSMGGAVHSTSLLPGSYVNKGEVVMTLVNPDFIVLQQTYLDAVAQLEFMENEYKRQRNLASHEAASQKRLQQSKADYLSLKAKQESAAAQLKILGVDFTDLETKGILPYLEIKAPLSGYVTNMDVNIGKYFNPGEPVCDVIDKRISMLQLTAYEKDLKGLQIGDEMEFAVNGMDGKHFKATLVSIDQMVDESNRSIKVYARIANADKEFRPGMYVSAKKVEKNN